LKKLDLKHLPILKKYIYRVIPNDNREDKELVRCGTTIPQNLFTDEELS
jgi:hypothetical protein